MKISKIVIIGSFVIMLLFAGCASTTRTVKRISTDEVEDLSGNWNSYDSKQVAEQMVKDLIYRPWLQDFVLEEDRKPVVVVA